MTVKIYVSKDSDGKEWGPDYAHEMEGVIDLLRRLWAAYHHLPQTYAVVVNLHKPAHADFVLISEHGIGILDLKHYHGLIVINHDDNWYAGKKKIDSGVHKTPIAQVETYAKKIRKLILPSLLAHLPYKFSEAVKFQTGIVFTNTDAILSTVRQQTKDKRNEDGDLFNVLAPWEIVKWAVSLRFESHYGRERNFEPIRLSPSVIDAIIRDELEATEWTEILPSIPSGEPYAYLEDIQEKTIYKLDKDTISLGRSPDCDIVIPANYAHVSRHHCTIFRRLDKVELQDKSTRGIFIDERRIRGSVELAHNQRISLGGKGMEPENCCLRFILYGQTDINIPPTQSTIMKHDKTN